MDKNTRTDVAVQKIKNDIVSGALSPGGQLKISELSNKYELGETPIREALNQLSVSGLILNKADERFFCLSN